MRVEPINCFRPAPERAGRFAAQPYDVFDDEQARAYVEENPSSFLAIDRPETAFPPHQNPYAPEVYAHAVQLLDQRVKDGTLLREERPCLYVYRLERDGHVQTGVVAAVAVDDVLEGVVRRHEHVREEKVMDRMAHIAAVTAQTSPVLLVYPDQPVIDLLVGMACSGEPLYDFTDARGVRNTVWRISRDAATEAICETFKHVPCAYVADGHHRLAAATRLCLEAHARGEVGGSRDAFLAILYPVSQMQVFAYNRVVADANGLSEQELVDALEAAGLVVGEPQPSPVTPAERATVGMYAFGAWRELKLPATVAVEDNPVATLDVSILQERVLAPILGITDPTRNKRISFVSGEDDTSVLERLAGEGGIAFSLYPTSVEDLMRVSDAAQLMPPKSTWFSPKPLSGLFLRRV